MDLNDLMATLAEDHPRWHFWRTEKGSGSLMATRHAHITDDLVDKGLARTLPMGITGRIEDQLAEQDAIADKLGI